MKSVWEGFMYCFSNDVVYAVGSEIWLLICRRD